MHTSSSTTVNAHFNTYDMINWDLSQNN